MRWLDKYILFSSVFALFTESFTFHYIIDWKLFYVIIFTNLILLGTRKKLTIHQNIIYVFLFFIVHGIVFYIWYQNPIKSLIAQLLGIGVSSVYYYNFLKHYGVKLVFNIYLKLTLVLAVLAIFMFYFGIHVFIYNRLNGILTEPAHYVAIALPATYVFFREKQYLKLTVLLVTVFLAKSSIGYIGLALIIILPLLKAKYLAKYLWAVGIVLGISGYYISTQWNKPIDENESNVLVRRLKETKESLNAVYTGKFEEHTNLSSYAFLSNTFITRKVLIEKPLGAGLGSYPHEYDKYYSELKPPPYLVTLKQSKINRTDANSLFLRLVADLGIFAFLFILFFVYRSNKLFKNDQKIIQQSTFFYLVLKLLREGHYFPPEFYFFLFIFLKDFDEDITYS
jgi:hypothetical protein